MSLMREEICRSAREGCRANGVYDVHIRAGHTSARALDPRRGGIWAYGLVGIPARDSGSRRGRIHHRRLHPLRERSARLKNAALQDHEPLHGERALIA